MVSLRLHGAGIALEVPGHPLNHQTVEGDSCLEAERFILSYK